jgi:hypothetical protein
MITCMTILMMCHSMKYMLQLQHFKFQKEQISFYVLEEAD